MRSMANGHGQPEPLTSCSFLLTSFVDFFSFHFDFLDKPIEIYFGYFTDKPILTVETGREPNFNYLGFASIKSIRALFFFECSDRNSVLPQHELLIDGIISAGDDGKKFLYNVTELALSCRNILVVFRLVRSTRVSCVYYHGCNTSSWSAE